MLASCIIIFMNFWTFFKFVYEKRKNNDALLVKQKKMEGIILL
jgi:hypothetical protein